MVKFKMWDDVVNGKKMINYFCNKIDCIARNVVRLLQSDLDISFISYGAKPWDHFIGISFHFLGECFKISFIANRFI
jgi:hypothetical protein